MKTTTKLEQKVTYSYKKFLEDPDNTTHLIISYNEEFVPAKLNQLDGLKFGYSEFKEMPNWLKDLTQLEELEIGGSQIKTIPDWFTSFKALKTLCIESSYLEAIPAAVLALPQLETLSLKSNQLKTLPVSIDMPHLKEVNLETNRAIDNRTALDFLMQLPALESYTLPSTMSLKYSYGKENPDVYYFDKFLATLCKKRSVLLEKDGLAVHQIKLLCHLFRQDKEALATASLVDFYQLLNASTAKYREMVLEHLTSLVKPSIQSLEGKKIAIIGKLKVKKNEQQAWLEETGALFVKKINKDVDYIIIGEQPKASLKKALDAKIEILIERNIWDMKDSAYLMDEAPAVTDSLKELLQNPEPENLEIAFQIMDQGGMPEDLIEEMIGIMQFHSDSKIRKRAKVLFDRFLQIELPDHSKKLLAKQAYRMKEDKKVTAYLRELTKETTLNLATLAYAVYRASGKEQAQGLCLMLPNASSKVIRDYVSNRGVLTFEPHTSLANGLYLEKFPAAIEEVIPEIKELNMRSIKIKDKEEYLRLKDLKGLVFHNGRAKNFPLTIFENTALESLDLVVYGLKTLDPKIGNLKKLKKLRIYGTNIRSFPKEMEELNALEEVTLSIATGPFPEFILKLKKLERLYIGTNLTNFPTGLEKIETLRRLSLSDFKNYTAEDQQRYIDLNKLLTERRSNSKK